MKLEAETGEVIYEPGKTRTAHNHQKLGNQGTDSPLDPSERPGPMRHLDFGLLATKTERIHFHYLKPPVCGTWLQKSLETNTLSIVPCAYCSSLCVLKPKYLGFKVTGYMGHPGTQA